MAKAYLVAESDSAREWAEIIDQVTSSVRTADNILVDTTICQLLWPTGTVTWHFLTDLVVV